MKKKISLIIPMLGGGGAERVLSYIANYFDDKGYEVTIYTFLDDKVFYEINDGVKHVHLNVYHKNKVLKQIKRVFALRRALRSDGSETVISFDRFIGIPAALFLGKKVISSERNDPYSNVKPKSFWAWLRSFLYARCDTMVFQTEYAKGYFSNKIQKNSVIIPNPIPDGLPDRFEGEREKKIVAVCRLVEQKNLPMMFTCVSKLLTEYPDYKFYLYGEGVMRKSLENHIAESKLEDRFILCGYVTDIPQRIRDAAMYISTSDFEGISNSMLEALALGIPSVCTDCPAGGAAMAIQSGENGILVPVRDCKAMYNAMKYIADNPDEAEKMSERAVEIREKWSADKICAEWERLV